jgi:phospholipase C
MVIVITYDEFGGAWDHVAPPQGDLLGPGARIPGADHFAVREARHRRSHAVRHRIDPAPDHAPLRSRALPGIAAATGLPRTARPMGDLTNALEFAR